MYSYYGRTVLTPRRIEKKLDYIVAVFGIGMVLFTFVGGWSAAQIIIWF